MKTFIIIPAYNEAKRIGKVLEELVKTRLPIVVVDDGSRDKTFETAREYPITALRHRINLGKGAALKTACEAAWQMGAEAVIMMDADGQHEVGDLPQFIDRLETGKYDVVFGSRNFGLNVPLTRFLGNKIASVLVSLMFGIYVSDILSGYRAFTKKAYGKIFWQSPGYGVETEMVIRVGKSHLRRCEVPIQTVYYDKFKGVTPFDAIKIFGGILKWRFGR